MYGAGFDSWTVERQASVCMHEYAHLLEQKRMGCKQWLLSYATVSGRMSSEGTAYALSDAALERYGEPTTSVAKRAKARAKRFPASYGLGRVLSPSCAVDYFAAIRRALRERAGV